MKKHLSLYVLLAALCFTLSPQKARAQLNEYFSIQSNWSSTTVTLKTTGTPNVNLEYSTDKSTWNPVEVGTAINVYTKTYFRGNNPTGFSKGKNDYAYFKMYSSSYNIILAGNIMSLVSGAGFANNCSTIPNDYCFYRLFYQENTATQSSCHQFDASNLSLPAEYLTTGCYMSMFELTNIYYLPQLPSQHLADSCYFKMFYRCQSIQTHAAGSEYVLPAEELAPHCYEYMVSRYTESTNYTNRYEIMATSLKDRRGNDIARCLGSLFQYQAASNKKNYWYITIYFKEWGSSTAATCPTYGWFNGGYNKSYNYFNHDADLPQTKLTSSPGSTTVTSNFPYSASLTKIYPTYLTFNCAANGGTWEEGSAYNTDLRRVVKANYTAKTIPAPPVKENARFLGWFTTASGDGSLLTEDQLKQITTATTVYARFVDNDKYTFFVNPSDKATITVTDNSSNAYTPGTLYILDSNDKTFTLSCTGETSGYKFYRWIGGLVDGNTVMFREGQKDLLITGVITPASGFDNASGIVYLSGSGAGTSNKVPLPSEAVDLGAAGIWAKYNVDKTTANGFASSETATGSYFAWGMTDIGSGYAGAASMSDGENLPVTVETDAAYKFCGNKWRIATKDEWATLLNNSTLTYVNTYDAKFTANGNSITLGHNGYQNNTGTNYFNTVIKYWTSTYYGLASSTQTAYAFAGTYNSGRYNPPTRSPILNYYTDENYSDGYNYIQYGYAIRPILNVNKRTLTIHALHLDEDDNPVTRDYIYECDLNQNITVTATADEQGFIFDHWEDSDGNLYSEDNPLTFRVYDNLEFTAVFEFGTLIEHHVTFYDEDGSTVLYEADFREGKKPVYRGETPTKSGYVFNGWSPEITKLGENEASYTATYIKVYTVTATAANGTIELTPASPTDQVSEGVYKTGTSLTMTVTADPGYVFTQWSDGNTQNPRTVSVTADASYTAEFRIESLPVSVDAYQSAPADVKQILYLLASQTGNDSKIYRPVDMGNGLAWANKNVGANDSIDNGSFFYWGGTTAVTTAATSAYYTSLTSMSLTASYDATQYPLPAAADAATVNMGERWRMPTLEEIYYLAEETGCTESGAAATGFFYTNNVDGKKIFIPSAGCYKGTSRTSGSTLFWGSTVSYKSTYQSRPAYYANGVYSAGTTTYYAWHALPVRAIYQPAYTPVTLTINAGERQYIYYCQPGQQVTVTAHPNTAANYLFDEWEDNHSTNPERTFTVTGNVTYTAKMKDNPLATSHTVTFQDYDGTTLQAAYSLIDGRVPVYSGAEPSRKGYRFTGWTDGNANYTAKEDALPAIAGNVVYTATYVKEPYLTITNTHASTATTVKMRKNSSSMTSLSFKYRILNANGEVTKNWTNVSVTASSSTGTTFGSIPAGGKMQIYGSGGYTANANYYDYFMITGGSPELSGNILSLVACSDGETVDNNYSLPTYCFRYLFYNCTALTSAEDLELPSTTVSSYAYYNMFYGCTGLTKAPKELPATTLGTYCYYQMFYNCSTLVSVPEELPALSLPRDCYNAMFQNCNALTTAPEIDATSVTGVQTCYNMFYGCRALTKAPSQLKIATLQTNTYYYMFYNCTSLKRSPDIRATTLASQALNSMFDGCTSLDTIRTYQTAWGYSNYWVRNVANTGVIYCPPTLAREYDGTNFNKMPKSPTYQWTIYSYNVTFNPVECTWKDATSSNKQFTWETDTTNVMTFLRAESAADATFYTDAECTEEISIEAIKADLEEQQEASAETTKNYYVRKVSAYELSWDANGGALDGTAGEDYTAAGSVNAGATITAPTATRTGYTFKGWSPDFTGTMPAVNTEYVAQWTVNTHNIGWVTDGNTLTGNYTNGTTAYGTTIVAPDTPTKTGCTFAGWDANNDGTADDVLATMPDNYLTYTALWTDCTISSLTLEDNRDATYYNTFANDYNGVDVETVTYNRTFAANTWSTVCLPFYVDADNLSGAGWLGSVYEFKHATGTADISEGLYLNFYPAREMEAGKGYLVYSQGAALEGGFEFYDVTIVTDADTVSAITDLVGYNDGQGTITLVGTLRQGTLTSNTRSQMALKDNKVWYPGSGTTTIRAYRGFFKDSSGSSIPPRVHIVVEGEVVTDLEIMENGELRMDNAEVRKYIDNGVLIIERNGIRYDAQGKRIEN